MFILLCFCFNNSGFCCSTWTKIFWIHQTKNKLLKKEECHDMIHFSIGLVVLSGKICSYITEIKPHETLGEQISGYQQKGFEVG